MRRRQFLRPAAVGSLAFGTTPILSAKAGCKFKTAIIGSRWWGMNVLKEVISGDIKAQKLLRPEYR
jgi:hypothetical protein